MLEMMEFCKDFEGDASDEDVQKLNIDEDALNFFKEMDNGMKHVPPPRRGIISAFSFVSDVVLIFRKRVYKLHMWFQNKFYCYYKETIVIYKKVFLLKRITIFPDEIILHKKEEIEHSKVMFQFIKLIYTAL